MIKNVVAGIVLLTASSAFAQTSLPPQAQAEVLVHKITASMEAGNAQEALDLLAEYRKLGVKTPPTLLFLEGRLAAIAKEHGRSRKALSEYLTLPEARADRNRAAAVALYADVETRIIVECEAIASRNRIETSACQINGSFRDLPAAPEMVIVPAGSFLMGSPSKEHARFTHEGPQREVRLQAFAVGKYEVTFDEWDACVANGGCNAYNPSDFAGRGRQPVINVSWNDAQAYVGWLSQATGKKYRLPSEAEWEYAARAEITTTYTFGDSITKEQANFFRLEPNVGVRPVGSYPANAFGLHDVHGNVWEWVQDCWNDSYQGAPIDGSAWITGDCTKRVERGGSWFDEAQILRSASRHRNSVVGRFVSLGFRVARTLD